MKDKSKKELFSVGTEVLIPAGNRRGEIIDGPNRKGEYRVRFGSLSITLDGEQLKEAPKKKAKKSAKATRKSSDTSSAGTLSIDFHGMTTKEAVEKLELLLDRALQEDAGRLEIVHGIGSGAIKKAVHDYLASSRHIASYKLAEGNPGTTWAYL